MKKLGFVNLAETKDGWAPFEKLGEKGRLEWGARIRREPWTALGYEIRRLVPALEKGRITAGKIQKKRL